MVCSQGALPRILWIAPVGAMNFAGYELAKKALTGQNSPATAAASATGVSDAVGSGPSGGDGAVDGGETASSTGTAGQMQVYPLQQASMAAAAAGLAAGGAAATAEPSLPGSSTILRNAGPDTAASSSYGLSASETPSSTTVRHRQRKQHETSSSSPSARGDALSTQTASSHSWSPPPVACLSVSGISSSRREMSTALGSLKLLFERTPGMHSNG